VGCFGFELSGAVVGVGAGLDGFGVGCFGFELFGDVVGVGAGLEGFVVFPKKVCIGIAQLASANFSGG
jgi:hypothetical protein